MNYQETIDYLFNSLPSFQRIGAPAYKSDLTNTLALCAHLGNPDRQFKSVHVAGTNGKGSSSHSIAAILHQAGYKTGLYTSPHLKSFTERIRIDGSNIAEADVVIFVEENKSFLVSSNYQNKQQFKFDNFDIQLSKKTINLFEIRKLSKTYNRNVIFSIKCIKNQDKDDLEQFIKELK
jgi:folylpolyglutamate synthase/dihydropteroate synthase